MVFELVDLAYNNRYYSVLFIWNRAFSIILFVTLFISSSSNNISLVKCISILNYSIIDRLIAFMSPFKLFFYR